MSVFLLLKDDDSTIIGFGAGTPDLVVSETHESTVTVTKHPVEKGADVTDHVRIEPKTLSLEVFVTNTPITRDTIQGRGDTSTLEIEFPRIHTALGDAIDDAFGAPPPTKIQVLTFPDLFDRVREIQDQLITHQEAAHLWTVVTASRTYEDMVIAKVSLPRDTPGGATFHIDLESIRTVSTQTVTAPKPAEKRGAPKQAKGSQGTTPKDAVKETSLAFKAFQLLNGGSGG